ncbi:MAG TPA: ATP-binding protein [Myxococcota bacterium]
MNPWFLVPLASGLICLACGILLLHREPDAPTHRCGGALLLGGAWWGLCEAIWTLAPDPDTALALVRLSTPGWVLTGALSLQLAVAEGRAPVWVRVWLPAAWGGALVALGLAWTTPWMHESVSPVAWGWAYQVGPAFAVWYVLTLAATLGGLTAVVLGLRGGGAPVSRGQRVGRVVAVAGPMVVGSTTDALLPLLDVQVPRLGVASFAVLGTLITATIHRFGWSLVTPGSFAGVVLDAMPEGVALIAPGGCVRLANPTLASLVGRPGDTLLGRPCDFLPGVELGPDSALREHECELERAGGERIPVAISTAPLRDRHGAAAGLVLVVRDLREVVALRNRLLTSARLAAVGELAAGIAHEINNPLAYINANLRALRDQWLTLAEAWHLDRDKPPDFDELFEDGLDMLDESLEGVDRTAAIVRDVRAFSHAGAGARERLDPHELFERALRMAEPHLRTQRATVVRELAPVPCVEGVRRELEQVLLNLILNAAQSLAEEGTVRVRTLPRGEEVVLSVADDGCGIPPELLDRIFDPFFTTKPAGEGTGLGLSISHEIVRRHGGRIEVRSQPGRGSEFLVLLPAAPA